ncbi:MAG: flippase [Dehalococcoidia bacterium]|nr:flippase [Dehalococcoidia bacterium]
MKFIRDTAITFSAHIIAVILGIAAVIVIARVLGPEGKGAYSLIILVPALLALLGNLGIGIANVYFGGSRKHNWTELASNSLISALGLGVLLIVGFLAYFFIFQPSFLQETETRYVVVATLVVPPILLTTYLSLVLLGQGRIKEYNLVSLAQASVRLVLILFLLFALKGGVFGAILAWAIAALMAAILSVLLVCRTTNIRWSFHLLLFKDSVKFGVKGYLGSIIQFLNYRLDMFLVALFMDVTFVGYYSISVVMAEALWYFPGAVGTVIFARTPGLGAEEANRSTPRICRNTLFITILVALVLFGLGKYILTLFFGSAFLPALRPLWILLPGVIALSIPKVLANEITGRGKPVVGTIAAGVSLAVNIPLNLVLIPRMGISGAALASTISYSVTALVVLVTFLRISGNSLVDTILLRREDLKLYADAFSTARNLDARKVKSEARAIILEAYSMLNPRFWLGSPLITHNRSTSNEQELTEQQGEDKNLEDS